MAEINFDRRKLKDVVHFICAEAEPATLGNVKLHKILYFADMLHYMSTGTALTGVEYQKQRFGPVARHLTWAAKQLAAEGRIDVRHVDFYGFDKVQYISIVPLRADALSNSERNLLIDVIDFVCKHSAREISDLSHNAAWQAADLGEVIPYESVYGLFPSTISDEDVRLATIEAKRIANRMPTAV